MKFEREVGIPELKAKTAKERRTLREQARTADPTIRKLELFGLVMFLFFTEVARWISEAIRPHSLILWLAIYLVLAIPSALIFRGFFIVPRIRRALSHGSKI